MMGLDWGELSLMYQQGDVSASQVIILKRKLGGWFHVDTIVPNNHTLVNRWSQRKLLEWEESISLLNLWDLDLQLGEGVGPLGKGLAVPQYIHIVLEREGFWVLKFMMPDSLRKKYIDRGYQFSDYVMNKAAQERLNFWSNPFAEGKLDKQAQLFELVNGRERYVFDAKSAK